MQCPIADARLHERLFECRRRSRRSRGFTLIELVAAIVIVGVIVAVAVPVFRDLRYDARRASVESVAAALRQNMQAGRIAYLAQGLGPGSTVRVNGKAIEVYGEGAVDVWGSALPPGAPTGAGMFVMMGCGSVAPAPQIDVPCESLGGFVAWVQDSWVTFALGPSSASNCYAAYYSPYDFAFPGNDYVTGWGRSYAGSEVYYAPASLGHANGC